MSSLTTT